MTRYLGKFWSPQFNHIIDNNQPHTHTMPENDAKYSMTIGQALDYALEQGDKFQLLHGVQFDLAAKYKNRTLWLTAEWSVPGTDRIWTHCQGLYILNLKMCGKYPIDDFFNIIAQNVSIIKKHKDLTDEIIKAGMDAQLHRESPRTLSEMIAELKETQARRAQGCNPYLGGGGDDPNPKS